MQFALHLIDEIGARKIGITHRRPARVADRDALLRIAEFVMAQVQRVGDARIRAERAVVLGQRQLIVVAQCFAFGDHEDRVQVFAARLQALNVAVVRGAGEQANWCVLGDGGDQVFQVQLVNLLAQHHALAGTKCLARFVRTEAVGQFGLWQRLFAEGSRLLGQARGKALRKVLMRELAQDALPIQRCTGVVPSNRLDRRLVQRLIVGDPGAVGIASSKGAKVFHIQLLDPAEASELSLNAVEIAMVIAVGAAESGAAPLVAGCDFADTVDRERQTRDPRGSGLLVLQIEAGGWGVFDFGGGTQVVVHTDQEMGLLVFAIRGLVLLVHAGPTHQVDVANGAAGVGGQM